MDNQQTSYANNLKSGGQNDASPSYSVKCTNLSNENLYFYFFQRTANQPSNVASIAWCVSEYKVPINSSFLFTWQETYSFVWQGYGQVQPRVVFTAQGIESTIPQTATTFSIENDTPVLSNSQQVDISGVQITTKFTVPDNQFGIGTGMSGVATFLTQAIPNTIQQFEITPIYYIACSQQIVTGTILSESSTDPKAVFSFPSNIFDLELVYTNGQFLPPKATIAKSVSQLKIK